MRPRPFFWLLAGKPLSGGPSHGLDAQFLRDQLNGLAPIDARRRRHAKSLQRIARAASIPEDASASLPRVAEGLVPLQRIYVLGDMVHREKCLTCACRHRAQPGWGRGKRTRRSGIGTQDHAIRCLEGLLVARWSALAFSLGRCAGGASVPDLAPVQLTRPIARSDLGFDGVTLTLITRRTDDDTSPT